MTDQKEQHAMRKFFIDEGKKWAVRWVFLALGGVLVFLLTPIGHKALNIWESPDRLDEISDKLDRLSDAVARLTGDNRVTRQPDDMSYVKEPVYFGDPVILILFIGRTEVGTACRLVEFIPQFTDENNVTLATEPKRPKIQLGPEVKRRIVKLQPPEGLTQGRTSVRIQLEYQCGSKTIYENTRPVYYYARPA